ncbi:MAG: thioredoxin [Halobacteriovoraceae bacterium]|nr:thioredoxin [Halobacteriovoraceae bacterium]MCB9095324.1 thioredoxin [Halobacteriovoraceae bacterium]
MGYTYSVCKKCESLNKVDTSKALEKEAVCGKCGVTLELHGLVSHVNRSEFQRIINKSEKPVVVDFWASWCGPCRAYGPEFEKASINTTEAVFLKVSTEEESALSSELGIRGIPCTIIYKNGREVLRQSGAMSSEQLKQLITHI